LTDGSVQTAKPGEGAPAFPSGCWSPLSLQREIPRFREKGFKVFDYILDAPFRCLGPDACIDWASHAGIARQTCLQDISGSRHFRGNASEMAGPDVRLYPPHTRSQPTRPGECASLLYWCPGRRNQRFPSGGCPWLGHRKRRADEIRARGPFLTRREK
jgi:hypothetical protein